MYEFIFKDFVHAYKIFEILCTIRGYNYLKRKIASRTRERLHETARGCLVDVCPSPL